MRYRRIGAGLLLAALTLAPGTGRVAAQENYSVPGLDSFTVPLPLGHDRLETGGFYTAAEFVYMKPNQAFGKQIIAVRGLIDTSGAITGSPVNFFNAVPTGAPGTFIGSGSIALTTSDLSKVNWQPGARYTIGWRDDSGVAVELKYLQLFRVKQTVTAGPTPPLLQPGPGLADEFLFAGVYNFPSHFAGPAFKTSADITEAQFADSLLRAPLTPRGGGTLGRFNEPIGFSAFGIWNGASNMEISLKREFQTGDLSVRLPVWDTEYARTYALAGGRFAWLFDRFNWRTQAIGFSTNPGGSVTSPDPANDRTSLQFFTASNPQDVAFYTNTLSQRLYGPFLGCGYEAYLGQGFSVNLDATGAMLINLIKERAKYELGDRSVANKRSLNSFDIVPNLNLALNVTWYPIRGVQLRAGYNFMGFLNAKEISQPVGFNYGAIEYKTQNTFIRLYQGFTFGVGLTF